MVIKTYFKTLWRMFTKHKTRLLSLVFMVLVSIGFVSGIGSATGKIDYSLDAYYKSANVSDFIIKSKTGSFSDETVAKISAYFGNATVNVGNSIDIPLEKEKRSLRLYFLDFDNWTVNVPELVEGECPSAANQAYAEQPDDVISGYSLGEEVVVDLTKIDGLDELNDSIVKVNDSIKAYNDMLAAYGMPLEPMDYVELIAPVKVTVTGIVQSPLTFAVGGEPSYNNPEDAKPEATTDGTKNMDCLENILYIPKGALAQFNVAMSGLRNALQKFKDLGQNVEVPDAVDLARGDIYVAISDRTKYNCFSKSYIDYANSTVQTLKSKFDDIEVLTLQDNYSFNSLDYYSEKVEQIGYVLMFAFIFVTALVALSTMTRLLDEERQQIACLTTLGYSPFGIISKYLLFAFIATGIGSSGAYFVGWGLSSLIYYVFNYSFAMPPVSPHISIAFFIINCALIVGATLGATAVAGFKMTYETPANLLRPKPPKAGKKVILEKIPVIWNRLSFKYKSTVRNVLRYKSRFILTVVAVAVSMALIMAGFTLIDLCLFHDLNSPSIMGVAVIVVVFAGLLTATVIYTLTGISISERNREIATLMVLGYHDGEVCGYIYREIYINTALGIILGYPLSVFMAWFVQLIMTVGTLAEIAWFMWIATPLVVLLFTALVTLILRRKIVKVDMNESLKAIE